MRSFTLLLILLITSAVHSETYTLDQFIVLVEKNSKDLAMAKKELEMSDAHYKEALSTALPKVFAEANYNRNLGKMFLYVDFPDMDTGKSVRQKFQMSYNNDYSATAVLQQTLFSFQIGDALRAAGQYDKMVAYIYTSSHQTIISMARKGFFRALLLKKVWEVKQAVEQNAFENYQNMQSRYDNGLVSELDLLQAEVNWKNTIPETSLARRNFEMGLVMLKNFAGIPVEKDIQLEGTLETVPVMPDSLPYETVLKQRPDFNALMWQRDLQQTGVSAEKSQFYPYLTGQFVYNFSASSDEFNFDRKNSAYFVGVTLQVPIYTGGYTSAQVQKAQINLDKADIQIRQTKDNIYNSMKNIRLRLNEAYSRIQSADKTRSSADRAFRITEKSVETGLTTQLELKDARMQLQLSVLNYFVATYDYIDAYYDWQLATGLVELSVVTKEENK